MLTGKGSCKVSNLMQMVGASNAQKWIYRIRSVREWMGDTKKFEWERISEKEKKNRGGNTRVFFWHFIFMQNENQNSNTKYQMRVVNYAPYFFFYLELLVHCTTLLLFLIQKYNNRQKSTSFSVL
jgi:hypothetical protein